jgi:hypothetical protein
MTLAPLGRHQLHHTNTRVEMKDGARGDGHRECGSASPIPRSGAVNHAVGNDEQRIGPACDRADGASIDLDGHFGYRSVDGDLSNPLF